MNVNKMTSIELRAIWGLGAVLTLRMLGIFMVLPVLTTYGMKLQGASESMIGLAIGIYGLVQSIFQIPSGLVSDRVGCKPLIISGLLIFMLGSIIAALTNSIWGVIIGRALQGTGTITAAVMAMLSDLTREQNRTKAMAFIGISFSIAFATSIVLGPIITQAIGLSGLFWGIATLTLVSVVIAIIVVPVSHNHTLNRESSIIHTSFGTILAHTQLLKLNFSIFCLHTILMLNFIVLPQIMICAHILPVDQWKVYLVALLVSFVIVVPCIIYAEIKRRIKHVFISSVIILLCTEILLLNVSHHQWMLFTGIELFFLVFNVMEVILPSLISKEAPAGLKGTAMGFYSTSQFLGVAFGGIMGGWLFQLLGASLVILTGVIVALVWWLVSITLHEPPYVTSLRITLPSLNTSTKEQLIQFLLAEPEVTEVVVIPEERSAYIKVDTKQINSIVLNKLNQIVTSHGMRIN
ncbi:MFS transporter [Candidatus Palibaumannia cicadellinicola]|uniref:YajR MFS transporter n=1 Tax=Candidatus Palibaumannia cicadellinicola TaxID=186490 RepID=A0A088NAN3_9GAMM|nr:MFS transporter [Candidatus Baumannia cicadellinicola]AIN47188.1 YajR MFS transporter [Candidatus Baumannia cicadellinicola]